MATELNSIIDENLFKSTTDGLTGNYTVRVEGGSVTYSEDSTELTTVYGNLDNLSDTTLSVTGGDVTIDGDYIPLTALGMWTDGESLNTSLDATAGTITVNSDGVYSLSSFVGVSADSAATVIGVKYSVNGVNSTRYLSLINKDIGDANNMSGSSFISLSSGDTLNLAIACDTTCNLTFKSAGLSLNKIG